MTIARLPGLAAEEKTAILYALKRVLATERRELARRTAQRICALERVIAALEETERPVDFDGLIPLFETVLAASRRTPHALH
jgi:hypothetical protein